MTSLPDPIRDALDDELDEAAIARLWRGTRERMHGRERPSRARMATALIAAAAAAAVLWLIWPHTPEAPGPLRLASGEPLASARTLAESRRLELDDASTIELGPRSALAVRTNDARVMMAELTHGRARFSVTPGTGRRWIIDCGLARVEVVGTVFFLEHRSEGLSVEVERGRVRVHARDGAEELGAGEHRLIPLPPSAEPAPPPTDVPVPPRAPPPSESAPAARATPRSRPAGPEAWRVLAERGAHREAYDALGARGIDARVPVASARELMLMADVARLSGHPAEAVRPLERLLAEHPRDPEAPLAAVILGRVEMDALNRPARAVSALERALALGVPRALADDVAGRLAIARLASGDRDRGAADADAYLADRPDGRHARRIRELLAR